MKKNLLALALSLLPMITSCGSYEYPSFGELKDGEKYNVGILLPVEHDALNKAADGFLEALEDQGYKDGEKIAVTRRNAQGNSDDQRTMAKNLMNDCVLTLGLGTGASQDLKSAQKNKGSQNPILFSAVTDPVDADLVESLDKPGGLITGTSDANPVEDQVSLIKSIMPDADKVGIFYTQSESNSYAQAVRAKAAVEAADMTAVIKTCTAATDLQTAFVSLLATEGLDAIYIPTDNNVASNMKIIDDQTKGKGVLVVAAEEGMLKTGGHVTLSVDYEELGKQTGLMAAEILSGKKKPADIPVKSMTKDECVYVMSSANLAEAGITLPDDVKALFEDIDD